MIFNLGRSSIWEELLSFELIFKVVDGKLEITLPSGTVYCCETNVLCDLFELFDSKSGLNMLSVSDIATTILDNRKTARLEEFATLVDISSPKIILQIEKGFQANQVTSSLPFSI